MLTKHCLDNDTSKYALPAINKTILTFLVKFKFSIHMRTLWISYNFLKNVINECLEFCTSPPPPFQQKTVFGLTWGIKCNIFRLWEHYGSILIISKSRMHTCLNKLYIVLFNLLWSETFKYSLFMTIFPTNACTSYFNFVYGMWICVISGLHQWLKIFLILFINLHRIIIYCHLSDYKHYVGYYQVHAICCIKHA